MKLNKREYWNSDYKKWYAHYNREFWYMSFDVRRLEQDRRNFREYGVIRPERTTCQICDRIITAKAEFGDYNQINLDHDYTTGKFRGWLCAGCNRAVGYFEKKQDRVLAYLGIKVITVHAK